SLCASRSPRHGKFQYVKQALPGHRPTDAARSTFRLSTGASCDAIMKLEQFAQVLHYRREVVCVIRQFGHEPKIRELEPGSDAAANQRIVAECAGCLPSSRRNGGGRLALGGGRREDAADARPTRGLVSEQLQRRAGIKMPDLV